MNQFDKKLNNRKQFELILNEQFKTLEILNLSNIIEMKLCDNVYHNDSDLNLPLIFIIKNDIQIASVLPIYDTEYKISSIYLYLNDFIKSSFYGINIYNSDEKIITEHTNLSSLTNEVYRILFIIKKFYK